ncbi:MAG: hypothetical protein JWM59_157 [Verrucomicrobiales bacterium]|nr:hypothetical protein [Verrucomicrobiales bacterium]
MKPTFPLLAAGLLAAGLSTAQTVSSPVPEAVRTAFKLDPFYQKSVDASGLPIVSSAKVRDQALREAAWIVDHLLAGRNDIREALAANQVRLAVMAVDEYTTDVPEHADLKRDRDYWDRRARGLGPSPDAPAVSCGEENLLCFPGDHYATENILIHEFAHAIHQMGLSKVDPTFEGRLNKTYARAMALGRWKGFYAGSNPAEYWAEGVQSWFDNNRENDTSHNFVNTRAELKEYDPELAALCQEVFGDKEWRYQKPADRPEKDREHLNGYDPATAPTFRWRPGTEDATKGRP